MDYEKMYKDALERAREIKSKILSSHLSTESCKAVSEYIDTIIPELAESENERIRKEIIHYILYKANGVSEKQEHEWIAYLEKQKEQKPVDDKAFEEWIDDWYQGSKEAGGDIVMSEAEFKNWSRGIRNMYQQKPAEWSEEDEEIFNNIIEKAKGGHWIEVNEITWLINRFKSLRPSWKPSEEQMEELQGAITFMAIHNMKVDSLVSLHKELKKL